MNKLLLAAALTLSTCAPSYAEVQLVTPGSTCIGYADGTAFLLSEYGETLFRSDVSEADGLVYQFYTDGRTGSFTLVQLSADGLTMCLAAYGHDDVFLGEES